MSVSVRVDFHGTRRKLRRVANSDFEVPLKRSGTYMEGAIGRRFRSGNGWKPLSPVTIELHPRRAGGKPLNDTGRLRKSVTSQAIKRVSSTKLQYGTNLKYAGIHNFGGVTGYYPVLGKRARIPKREFLYFDATNEKAIKRIFEDYVKELSN